VATDLQTGELVMFRKGNTGTAVRASSSVPGVFQPVTINGREYVDGGLVSPVPVKVARSLGADVVIAVDISNNPKYGKISDSMDILLQTFAIMGQTISRYELAGADVVIRPNTGGIGPAEFEQKHLAILEGEKAALSALPLIQSKIQQAPR
jgi:NTE family protein